MSHDRAAYHAPYRLTICGTRCGLAVSMPIPQPAGETAALSTPANMVERGRARSGRPISTTMRELLASRARDRTADASAAWHTISAIGLAKGGCQRSKKQSRQSRRRQVYPYQDLAEIEHVTPILNSARTALSFPRRTASASRGPSFCHLHPGDDGHSEENSLSAAIDNGPGRNATQALGSSITCSGEPRIRASRPASRHLADRRRQRRRQGEELSAVSSKPKRSSVSLIAETRRPILKCFCNTHARQTRRGRIPAGAFRRNCWHSLKERPRRGESAERRHQTEHRLWRQPALGKSNCRAGLRTSSPGRKQGWGALARAELRRRARGRSVCQRAGAVPTPASPPPGTGGPRLSALARAACHFCADT